MTKKLTTNSIMEIEQYLADPRMLRLQLRMNQTKFWKMFGVTQSAGSRYEKGRSMPRSIAILISMLLTKQISQEELIRAAEMAKACVEG